MNPKPDPIAPAESSTAEQPRLLTIKQAAQRLQVGRCTMQELLLTGEIRSLKIGRLRRVPPEAIDQYIADRIEGDAA